MIQPEKVRRMNDLAMMASGPKKKQLQIAKRKRSDYLTMQMILSLIAGTLCFFALFGLWLTAQWSRINAIYASSSLRGLVGVILLCYIAFILAYLALSMVVFSRRYRDSKELARQYAAGLEELERTMERGSRSKTEDKTAEDQP